MKEEDTDLIGSEIKERINHWWVFLLIGVLLLVSGVFVFFQTGATLVDLKILFVILFIVSGILEIFFSSNNRLVLSSWGGFLGFAVVEVLHLKLIINEIEKLPTMKAHGWSS